MKPVLVLAVALILSGCGGSPEPQQRTAAPESQQSAAAPKRETVFDPLVGTIDRAKGVQQTVDDQAAERRRQIEEAER
jgi:hypothetical protein